MYEQWLSNLRSHIHVAKKHDEGIEFDDKSRRKKENIARQRLMFAFVLVDEVRLAEILADKFLLVGVMHVAINIATQFLIENPEN